VEEGSSEGGVEEGSSEGGRGGVKEREREVRKTDYDPQRE
jgi:hypothetical protein